MKVRIVWACCALLAAAGVSGVASAQGVSELTVVEQGGRRLIVALSPDGVAFVDVGSRSLYRAWPVKGRPGVDLTLADADSDGDLDVIAAGRPAFIISGDGDPISSVKGACDQVFIQDFAADRSVDVVCRKGTTFTATTHDGQKLWEYKLSGLKVGACAAGDLNGDNKSDLECSVGRGRYLRLDGAGNEQGRDFESAQLDHAAGAGGGEPSGLLLGEQAFDLDGDGTAEETLAVSGAQVIVRSRAKGNLATLEVGKITAALAEDLDRDGKADVVLGGEGKVFFLGADGKVAATVVVDPKKVKREATAVLNGVSANGLESDDLARATVQDQTAKLAGCYTSNVKKDPYARVGRVIFNLLVDEKGKVSKAERLHSDLNDKGVEGCIQKTLSGVTYPKATQPGASVTVTLRMGFFDR